MNKLFPSFPYLCFKTSRGEKAFIVKWVFLARGHGLGNQTHLHVHQDSFFFRLRKSSFHLIISDGGWFSSATKSESES